MVRSAKLRENLKHFSFFSELCTSVFKNAQVYFESIIWLPGQIIRKKGVFLNLGLGLGASRQFLFSDIQTSNIPPNK